MTTWTITKEVFLRHRPVIDSGGRGRYGGLELTVRPASGLRGLEVENLDTQNPEAEKWSPHLKAGFEDYQARRASEGRPIGGVRLSVTRVYSHPSDTDARLMRRLAAEAIRRVFEQHERAVEA